MFRASWGRSLLKTSINIVEAGLLLKEVCGSVLGGFFLQSEMHALVTAVLLRMARLDPFNANPQAEPPDRELAQME